MELETEYTILAYQGPGAFDDEVPVKVYVSDNGYLNIEVLDGETDVISIHKSQALELITAITTATKLSELVKESN